MKVIQLTTEETRKMEVLKSRRQDAVFVLKDIKDELTEYFLELTTKYKLSPHVSIDDKLEYLVEK